MNAEAWYDRPFVAEITEIFGHPKPPAKVTEKQFDQCQKELEALSQKPWHEIVRDDYWYYMMDLPYVALQRDLFDYLFPALLIFWREGMLTMQGGPYSECDLYYGIYRGEVLWKMMDEHRREAVLDWMHDGFIEAVDMWSGKLKWNYQSDQGGFHFFLWTFHAFGQSTPITSRLWESLSDVATPGRAQFWIVLAAGFAYPTNTAPFIPPWTPNRGGGGVYLNESETSIYDSGFIPENLEHLRQHLTLKTLSSRLDDARMTDILPHEHELVHHLTVRLHEERDYVARKLAWYLDILGKPNLGGVGGFPGDPL